MKVSAKGNSRFLAQDDVPEEGFTAIIKDVRVEAFKSNRGDEDKYVLYFTAGKPMVFNVVNRQTVIASYGDDSDNWLGKPVEIYVDPNVYMGGERTGGIRVCVPKPAPAQPRPVAATIRTAPPAPKPTAPAPENDHERAIDGMDHAQTRANLDEWAAWGKRLPLTPEQREQQEDAYHRNLERIAMAATARRPARATA